MSISNSFRQGNFNFNIEEGLILLLCSVDLHGWKQFGSRLFATRVQLHVESSTFLVHRLS
jgi:hypothetical protein